MKSQYNFLYWKRPIFNTKGNIFVNIQGDIIFILMTEYYIVYGTHDIIFLYQRQNIKTISQITYLKF